jgi:hypothetical protein
VVDKKHELAPKCPTWVGVRAKRAAVPQVGIARVEAFVAFAAALGQLHWQPEQAWLFPPFARDGCSIVCQREVHAAVSADTAEALQCLPAVGPATSSLPWDASAGQSHHQFQEPTSRSRGRWNAGQRVSEWWWRFHHDALALGIPQQC